MIKVILYYEDNTLDYSDPPCQEIFVKNEEEFWKIYNKSKEYGDSTTNYIVIGKFNRNVIF